jgi:glycosyltransferase involved in cell wall biosynthesis
LAGGGPFEKALRHHHHKNIILTGEVKYPEILHYYCMGDIFVFSSLTETQGMVLAEAKANRLPVVALFAGGLCGTVRSGIDGYLVSRDQAAFISHVERLLHDQELIRKMSTAAYSDALERLSSTVVAKKIESIYNSLICSVKPETCE